MSRPATSQRWTLTRVLLVLATFLYLGFVLLAPLGALITRAAGAGVASVIEAVRSPSALHGLKVSFALAAIAVVVNAVVGIGGGIVLARHRFVGRALLDALVEVPLAVSPVAIGLAFILLFGRNGWLEPVLNALGVKVTFSFLGMVLATLFVTLPYTLRETVYVLDEIGTDEEQAAATLGASAFQTFWHVTLPNLRHALGYGVLLTAARALGEFGAVLVIGGDISGDTQTATTFIYAAVEERNEPQAYGMAIVLAVASSALLLAIEWVKHRKRMET